MTKTLKSTEVYAHPFCKGYWRDAAAELKDTKMLVVTALMIALRVALKPLAIPLGPQLSIQTAMLATALGAMIFGPVVAIPAAMISDTVGFFIYPTGDYFLPFMLTEIASTMIYAIFLYRAKVSPVRVMLSRFCICFFVNVVLQQFIYAWWYAYIGNPEKASQTVLSILTLQRILKNVCMFPLESVVLTVFLRALLPVVRRAKLVHCADSDMKFTAKQIAMLVLLTLVGIGSAIGYLGYRYNTSSRSADYSDAERVEHNKAVTELVLENSDEWDDETVLCVVNSAYRPLFGDVTEYTVAVYTVADGVEVTDAMWGYSKSPAAKDENLTLVGTANIEQNEDTGEILSFSVGPAE